LSTTTSLRGANENRAAASAGVESTPSRRALATRGRSATALLILALVLIAFAATAASASAAPTLGAKTEAVSNVSYTSAHITGHVSTPGPLNAFFENEVRFQYSTDKVNWTTGSTTYFRLSAEERFVEGDITGLKAATTYYARISIAAYPNEAASSAPYLSFTTLPVEAPTISLIDDASEVFSMTAAVAGKVKRPANSDPAFNVTACRFEYVTDAQFTATGFQGAGSQECELFNPIKAPGEEEEVSAELEGLTPSTTYHLRLAAENAAPVAGTKEAAHTFTTAAKVAKPIIIAANDATELKINGGNASAKFSGEVQRPLGDDLALNVTCRFEYVTDAQFNANPAAERFSGASEAPCAQNPITKASANGEGKLPVSAEVFGYEHFKTATTYHLRLVAENSGGVAVKEVADTFTTLPARFPVFTVNPATAGYTTAEVSGTVNPEGGDIDNGNFLEWGFEYSTEPSNPSSWTVSSASGYFYSTEETPIPVSGRMTGLTPGITYYFRMYANNYLDIVGLHSTEPYLKFTTKGTAAPPSVTLEPVSGLTVSSAHFSGFVNTNAPPGPLDAEAKATYKTEWQVECVPGCPGLSGTVEAEEGSKAIGGTVERLEGNTFYENVRLIAHNELGTVETPARTFQTPLVLPTVVASAGGSAGSGSYNVSGTITPFNSKISNCHFEYGPTTEYVYSAPCTPDPVGRSEVQLVLVGSEGPFKLSFRGQTTESITPGAPGSVVESELQALSVIGPEGVSEVKFESCFFCDEYTIHFSGPLASTNVGPLQVEQGGPLTTADTYLVIDGGNNAPVLVEAHLTGLTPGATYHYRVAASNPLGTVRSGDNTFVPPLAVGEAACPNEQERIENSSSRLPECRAYELVTNAPKAGFGASLTAYSNNEAVGYGSTSGNIENSGQGNLFGNQYLAKRSASGWYTVANLNGPKGSPYTGGSIQTQEFRQYSPDLERSIWFRGVNGEVQTTFLREADGEFKKMNPAPGPTFFGPQEIFQGASQDLSHTFWLGTEEGETGVWGPGLSLGIYEYEGTGNTALPHRVDLKNNGEPISECPQGGFFIGVSWFDATSADGKTVFFTKKPCEGHAEELFARVDASKTIFVSESQCTRTAAEPGGACYTPPGPYAEGGPADATFQSATLDASRVFFTTAQQLVNGDTNKSTDLYRYELPSVSNPNPSPALIDITSSGPNAQVQQVLRTSEDGSTVYFLAKGVLASNHDALDEPPHDGDENMYVWHQDASHPEGQTTFVGRLSAPGEGIKATSEITPDGRYFLFRSYSPLTPTDTDNAADIYRYDLVTGELIRVSVDSAGTGGNGDSLDAEIPQAAEHTHPSITDDGEEVVFSTSEALSSDDGNGAPDVYIWKDGHTSLISTGSVGGGASGADIDASGRNVYFGSGQELTQEDTDSVGDVYDARVDGGVNFTKLEKCIGEACQPSHPGGNSVATPGTDQSKGSGNYQRATVSVKALSSSQLEKLATGGKVGLSVRVSGGGKISAKGTTVVRGKQVAVVAATSHAVQPGTVSLPISLSKSAQSQLRGKGALEVNLSVSFADSEPASSILRLRTAEARPRHSKKGNG
jgi:hypothetical protein